jgi:hypothetical protein
VPHTAVFQGADFDLRVLVLPMSRRRAARIQFSRRAIHRLICFLLCPPKRRSSIGKPLKLGIVASPIRRSFDKTSGPRSRCVVAEQRHLSSGPFPPRSRANTSTPVPQLSHSSVSKLPPQRYDRCEFRKCADLCPDYNHPPHIAARLEQKRARPLSRFGARSSPRPFPRWQSAPFSPSRVVL